MTTICSNDHIILPSAQELLIWLKKRYLPELRALHSDCNWLKSTLLIDMSRELQPNEAKLLQFVSLIDAVMKEITTLKDDSVHHDARDLSNLEAKIVRTILPVKARLHERWKQQIEQESKEQQFNVRSMSKIEVNNKPSCDNEPRKVTPRKLPKKRENRESVPTLNSKSKRKSDDSPCASFINANCKVVSNENLGTNFKPTSSRSSESDLPKIPHTIPQQGNTSLVPISFKHEDSYAQYFVIDHEVDTDVNENIFDNISDCGVDLLEDNEDRLEINNFGITSPETSSVSDSVSGKRRFNTISSTTNNVSTGKKEKPPGPYYSSAVDLDLKSSFSSTIVTLKEEEYMSSRRRRRLNQIVPYPRKPRQADYSCSVCGEGYQCTVNENPWWAVYKHECPHCKQFQIPRIDIGVSSNAIELDPNVIALYGEGIEDSGDDGAVDSDEYTDDEEADIEAEDPAEEINVQNIDSMRIDEISFDGEGLLTKEEASKLLILMCHARTCSGEHISPQHEEICRSTKFLMLHIRDCKGVDIQSRDCLFPWCQPCKKMLKHLAKCDEPSNCAVCNPWSLPQSFHQLRRLNQIQCSVQECKHLNIVHTSNSVTSLC